MEENKNIETENEEVVTENEAARSGGQATTAENQVAAENAELTEKAEATEAAGVAENPTVKKDEADKTEPAPKKSRKEIKAEREEARRKELATLSDDELYARLQTEKLLKSKKNKRIATFTTLIVAFVLALSVIIMAVVPYNYVPACISGSFSSVNLYKSGSTTAVATITEDDERYSTFTSLLNSAFQQNFLTALFSGTMSSYVINENDGVTLDEDYTGKDTASLSKAIDLAGENYLIQFNYSTDQTFTYQSGRTYKSNYRSSSWDGVLYYRTAYLAVRADEDEGIIDTDLYIVAVYPNGSTYKTRLFTVTVKAETSIIYANWSSLMPS